jgi:hypothetical protein
MAPGLQGARFLKISKMAFESFKKKIREKNLDVDNYESTTIQKIYPKLVVF